MDAERTQQSLETLLTEEVERSAQLLTCLDNERHALARRDTDALEITTREKLEHTQALENLERQRESLLNGLGYESDQSGLRRCLKQLPRGHSLAALWRRLLANIEACRNANLANGGVLEAGRQHVDQALGILRGQGGAPTLYTTEGATRASLGQRELGKV